MKKSKTRCLLLALALPCALGAWAGTDVPRTFTDPTRPLDERVEDALSRMTVQEKINIIHAQSKFSSPGVPRLGIPELWTDDGPHGVRPDVLWDEWEQAGQSNDSCVAFPALTCLAATWNPDMARLYGRSLGEEARYRGKDVILGPGVNIYRTPLNGRNFEYMGEDPRLASRMVVPYIQGLQSCGVAACVKHFALNNNEVNRHTTNVIVDDRTLYEIYLPAFQAAVTEGDAWSIMGAYNLYGDEHLCHNGRMLNDILKKEWGFKGVVVSDWGGTHDTAQAIANGLDLEFGSWTDGLANGTSNAYDNYYMAQPYFNLIASGKVGTAELDDKARRVLRLIMLTAMNPEPGFGSLCSEEHYDAARRIGDEGIVLLRNKGNVLPVTPREGMRILVVGENAIKMMTVGGGSSSLKAQRETSPLDGIRAAASRCGATVDYARGYVGDVTGEYNGVVTGQDLRDDGNAVAMPWAERVPAIVQAWYLGSEAGNSIADVIFGAVNPSGKLPFTFPVRLEDSPAHALGAYPGVKRADSDIVDLEYKEGILVGYRWYDTKKIKPLFAFGHGLSYTDFKFGKATADRRDMTVDDTITFTVPVTNTGSRAGAEVVQLYVSDPKCSVMRPAKELKGFAKVWLEPGETKDVKITIHTGDLTYFDAGANFWVAEPGEFVASIGPASDNIKTTVKFKFNLK